MQDIPEVQEVRFVSGVMAMGRTLVTQLRATDRFKMSVKSGALVVVDNGRVACLVPLSNVASIALPAPAAPAVKK